MRQSYTENDVIFLESAVRDSLDRSFFDRRLSAILAARRQELGWSQDDLGLRIGVTRAMVSRYERGDSVPGLRVFAQLCRTLVLDARLILSLALSPTDLPDSTPDSEGRRS